MQTISKWLIFLATILYASTAVNQASAGEANHTKGDYQLNLFAFNIASMAVGAESAFAKWLTSYDPDVLLFQEDYKNSRTSLAKTIAENRSIALDKIVGNHSFHDGHGIASLVGGDAFDTNSFRLVPINTGLQMTEEPHPSVRIRKGNQDFDIVSVHFKGDDRSVGTNARRDIVADALLLGEMADGFRLPTVMGGDFNAGDTSATGLRPNQIYPTADNLPTTMSILKKSVQVFRSDVEREPFAYQKDEDSNYTWPNPGYGCTTSRGCWGSTQRWDRTQIDHFVINRPYAKWFYDMKTADDFKADVALRTLNAKGALSDHNPINVKMGWVMPISEMIDPENESSGIRLTFDSNLTEQAAQAGAKANWYSAELKEFYLSRNNDRSDVYLGQMVGADGKPVLTTTQITTALGLQDPSVAARLGTDTGLDFSTDPNAVFKVQLDCHNAAHLSLSSASEYCIDDHSRFSELVISDGQTVVFDEAEALGSSSAKIILNNGGLRTTNTNDLWATLTSSTTAVSQSIYLQSVGWINVSAPTASLSLSGAIDGQGSLVKQGDGALVLDHINSFTGGTLVEGGVLQAGVDGAFVNNTAFAVNGGKLDLNNFNVSMSSLMGEGGTLSLGSAALTVNQSANTRFDGNIDGTGSLTKSGSGVLVLNGADTYTGGTTVKEGGLVIGDASHSGAFLGGTVSVENGAHLSGAGFIGGLYAGAGSIIAPGNSIGTLKVTGNLAFDAGATYVAEIDAAGKSDRIDVSGTAALGGAKVYVEKAAGTYMPGKRYTILSAEGGITGTFGDMSQNMPFVDLGLAYDANAVYLDIARNDVDFIATVKTSNQKSVALAVEELGAGNAVYDTVVMQDSEDNARRAFNALSGEVHASTRTAIINDSSIVRNAVMDRIGAAFGGERNAASSSVATDVDSAQISAPRAAIWGQALGQWSETGADGNAGKLKQSTGGFVAGYDAEVVENWRLGALAGYSRTNFDVNDRNSSGHSDNYHLGIYGGTQWDATLFKAGVAYSWHKIETDRFVAFPGFSESLDADYSANTFQAFGELSHRFDLNGTAIEPFANVAVVRLQTDRFNEHGGNAALQIGKETTTTTFTTLGLRASAPVVFGSMNAKLNGTVGWQHAYGDTIPTAAAAFDAGTVFEVAGAPIAKDTAIIKAGFDIDLGNQTTLGLEYSGQYGSSFNQNSGKAKLSVKF
ncbi:autotransporter domain-containing protein [Brucella sp. TWI432]